MNEKTIAIPGLVLLGIAELAYCFFSGQTPQNIGIIAAALAGLVGNSIAEKK